MESDTHSTNITDTATTINDTSDEAVNGKGLSVDITISATTNTTNTTNTTTVSADYDTHAPNTTNDATTTNDDTPTSTNHETVDNVDMYIRTVTIDCDSTMRAPTPNPTTNTINTDIVTSTIATNDNEVMPLYTNTIEVVDITGDDEDTSSGIPEIAWQYGTDEINELMVNGESCSFVVRTFDTTNLVVPSHSRYYDPVPINPPWLRFIHNYLVMAAVKLNGRVILSRCALYHADATKRHRYIVIYVLMTMCVNPFTAYIVCDTTRILSPQADMFSIWKDADMRGYYSDPSHKFNATLCFEKFFSWIHNSRMEYKPERQLMRNCYPHDHYSLPNEKLRGDPAYARYLLTDGKVDIWHEIFERRAPAVNTAGLLRNESGKCKLLI